MSIPDEEVAQVRAATDIVALIAEHAALRQQGRRWVGLCPFHSEKTPSFSVNAQDGFYYCFGCQASGDAITFVRATEHLDFADAVRFLADLAGIVLHESEDGAAEHRGRSELLAAMAQAVSWYHERLLSAPDAGRARDYLRSRGYDGAIVRKFSLGWAPDEWDALSRALRVPQRVLVGCGLAFVNRAGRLQDAFRNRVLFPIFDPSGRAVAIGGRILPGANGTDGTDGTDGTGATDGANGTNGRGAGARVEARAEPKYKNSQESAIYSKRRTLYALNWAKKDVVATQEVVVCEGYTDVIGCFTSGVERAVATCGTALGEDHFRLLRNFARRIVLAYDADQAGQSATARVYEWEKRHDVDLRVAVLPGGADPGDLARSAPDALRSAIASAVPFLQFRLDRLFATSDLSTAEGRARAAEAALDVLSEHPDALVRDQYLMRVADLTRIDAELLRTQASAPRRALADDGVEGAPPGRPSRPRPDPGNGVGARAARRVVSGTTNRPGLEALRLAVHRPDLVADRLEAMLFVDDLQRRAFLALAESESLGEAVATADEDVAHLLRRISAEEPPAPDDTSADPADAVLAQVVRQAVRRALAERQALARAEHAELASFADEISSVRRWMEDLDHPTRSREATDRLVAWLSGALQEGPSGGSLTTTEPG